MLDSKNIFIITSLFLSVLTLSACGPEYQTNYSYIPPHAWRGRQCVNQCLTQRSYCQSQCASQNQSCRTTADLEALPSYLSYEHHQRKSGNPSYENVSDFADYSSCTNYCGCATTYRDCFSNCGGTVIASTQCVAFCKQQ